MPNRSSTPDAHLRERVKRIIDANDPEGLLRMGAPRGEYDSEIDLIASKLAGHPGATVDEIETIVVNVWTEMFSPVFDPTTTPGRFRALAVALSDALEAAHG